MTTARSKINHSCAAQENHCLIRLLIISCSEGFNLCDHQVLQDRGESGSRHGRATFSVLLLQDLAVVALLMLIPLLAPTGGGSVGLGQIAQALGMAAVKAVVCIAVIISAGRALLRPLFRQIAAFANAEIFAATTLLTCIGTSLLTQVAGLSMALGAFLVRCPAPQEKTHA